MYIYNTNYSFLPFQNNNSTEQNMVTLTNTQNNLSVGQSFESSQELCDYVKKSNKTITEWRNKGWIE